MSLTFGLSTIWLTSPSHRSGCTAIFIVSQHGFWGGHLWEASGYTNGYSAFNRKFADGVEDHEPMTVPHFNQVGVDILEQNIHAHYPYYMSLKDLRESTQNGVRDPLGDGTGVHIWILTKQHEAG
jgi:hypothetical protein